MILQTGASIQLKGKRIFFSSFTVAVGTGSLVKCTVAKLSTAFELGWKPYTVVYVGCAIAKVFITSCT